MCRKNQLWAIAVIGFGFGLLVGAQISSGFWCGCAGIVIVILGILFFRKRT